MTHAPTRFPKSQEEELNVLLSRKSKKEPIAWLVVTTGVRAGERIALTGAPLVIGRAEDADLQLMDTKVSEHHARLFLDGTQWVIEEASPRHETFVNDLRVAEYVLRDGDRIRIGRSILKLVSGPDSESRCADEVFHAATHDALTLVGSSASFQEALARETNRARRHDKPLALLFLDVDGFSALNDEVGDAVGSAVLQMLCARLRPHLRQQDLVARVGDDEFAVLLPEMSSAALLGVAENLRARASEDLFVVDDKSVRITVSAGVASFDPAANDETFTALARKGLERAREEGGDRVGII